MRMSSVLTITVALAAFAGCRKDEVEQREERATSAAEQAQERAEQAAESVKEQGEQRAEALREQAKRVEEQAEKKAEVMKEQAEATAEARKDQAEKTAEGQEKQAEAREEAREEAGERRDVDNTAVNKRDRDDAALTAQDQGETEQDRNLAARIRQAVVKDDSLSMTAKNIKIIARDGKVTLKGPVKTTAERDSLVNKASDIAGRGNVSNQLEVTARPAGGAEPAVPQNR